MDELELLKQDWKKQEENLPIYDKQKLSPMLQQKSTSVVKWIFIISIIEFSFWIIIDLLLVNAEYNDLVDELGVSMFMKGLIYVNYIGVIGFIAWFCRNYMKIKVTDDVRTLIKRIIETRRSVKYYVWFNLIIFAISFSIGFFAAVSSLNNNYDENLLYFIVFFVISIGVIGGLIWLIYYLIYGRLIRRLIKNYKEFKREE
jgi:hypothetical protein